jgi:lysophospholipase L1-like esterase
MNSFHWRPAFSAWRIPVGLLLFHLPGPVAASPTVQVDAPQLIPASDARFRYEGRMDFSDQSGPVVVWAGSRISLDFAGPHLAVRFAESSGQNYFNVQVDGANTILGVAPGATAQFEIPVMAGPGRHHLVLFKRSEGAKGQVRFGGVELAAGAQAWAPEAPAYRLKIEFFGDSITVGACNEDGAVDQWEDFRTHNHALSYDCLTSQAFHADHRAVAVSGMGIVSGWIDVLAGQVWDKLYPVPDSARADLKTWQPDVAFVNLGENDSSFALAHAQPFPSGFAAGYVALVKAIRAAYPKAQLVLLRGGMYGGAKDPAFRAGWETAVKELEAGDSRIRHFVFTHWSTNHPRVADDQALADELTVWLKRQAFMVPFL